MSADPRARARYKLRVLISVLLLKTHQRAPEGIQFALEDLDMPIRHVLAHYGAHGGIQAGSFTTALIALIDRADDDNRQLLTMVFPIYGCLVQLIQTRQDGTALLQHAIGETP